MMMANAIVDIPPIRRINKLENVLSMRQSTGKMIMPNGGLPVVSRYLQYSPASCHDICKYGTNVSPGTESKIPRSPMRKLLTPKRDAGRNLESSLVDRRTKTRISAEVSPYFLTQGHHGEDIKEDLTDTKNSTVSVRPSTNAKPRKPDYHAINLEPSREYPFDNKVMEVKGEAKYEENVETKLPEGEKSQQVSVKPSPDSECKKPINPDCIERGESCWTDKEFILPEQVLSSRKETECAVGHAKDSKPSMCQNGKQKFQGPKRKEENIMSMTSTGISGGRNKGEMTISKGIRTSMIANKKSVVPPSVSSTNTQKKKLRVVYHLKKHEKLQGMDAKRSDNVNRVSHLLDPENVKRLNSEQAKSANIPETTSYPIESNPENKPAEPDQNNVVSIRTSSSSKDKSMKQIQNKIPISRPPRAYEKKKMIYVPKGMQGQASGLAPSLSSFLGMKSLRPTPNGSEIAQPSLTSVSSLPSLQSFHNDTSTEHAKVVAEKKKSSSKMMYKVKPKRESMITSNNKHLRGKKLSFWKREPFDNRNDVNQKGKVDGCTPRRIRFKQRINADNINGDNQNSGVEEFTPKRLKFRPRVNTDQTNGANQNSRVKEFKPKRLKFKQRVIAENPNGDNHNIKVEEFTSRRLEFRKKVIADNKNNDNQNSGIEELSPRTLEFRQKLLVDNQNGRVDEFTLTRPELSQRAFDNRNVDDQNDRGEDSTPRILIFRQKGVDETKTGSIQSPKASTSESNSGGREADAGCDNDTKIQSEKFSLRHRGVNQNKGLGSLYNNIIEQTASKLVETKASKVKALVSAFETVISHLDTGISETNDGN
ncbi:hypothetical protein HRI_001490200 [Hibiscus trionum]|uniref:Calmodulin-binding domain-containing protein n=1 Tax=Hibiscus trionum TaxID=183268 RepID=A0A9W7HII5_HIBTR|nr:hypothetical protein HRI_001490200 [Hibiscus trionum]